MMMLRSVLFIVLFNIMSALFCALIIPMFACPSAWCRYAFKGWGMIGTYLARLICGIKTEVRGLEHLPKEGGCLIAGKHLSMFDTNAPFLFLPDVAFVMKRELVFVPLFGWWCLKGQMIVVDRDGGSASLKKMAADARERLADNRQIVIFPEGTRAKIGQAPEYKPGVALLYRELGVPCCLMATNSGAHWKNKSVLKKPGTIVFEFLPPIPPGLKSRDFMATMEDRLETASNRLIGL